MSAEAAPRTAARKRTKRLVVGIGSAMLVVAVVAGVLIAQQSPDDSTSELTTAECTETSLTVTVAQDGALRPIETTDVYPAASGTVTSVSVKAGDTVKAGDELFTIDGASLQAQVLQAEAGLRQSQQAKASALAQLEQAELQLAQAQQQLSAIKSLPATQTTDAALSNARKQVEVANASLSAANAALSSAKASVASAEASLALAQRTSAATTVYAPVDGVITSLAVAKGATVSSGASGASLGGSGAPVVIANIRALQVTIEVNQVEISQVATGQPATITFDAVRDLSLDGEVTWIAPMGTSSMGVVTYTVEITLAGQDERLRPDMTASVNIVTSTIDSALVVPSSAVKVDGSQRYVDVLNADGTTVRTNVTVGATAASMTEIVSGLAEGATVVIGSIEEDSGMSSFPGMSGN